MKKRHLISPAILLLFIATIIFYQQGRAIWFPIASKFMDRKTVSDVIETFGEQSRQALKADFARNNVAYPPKHLALIAYKDSDLLEVWAGEQSDKLTKIKEYPILAASGILGPKLREGDRQVPEGLYKIIGFNPNSAYHVSMKLNYPNDFDMLHAKAEGRTEPGTNIFIHGKAASIGCLAMGDPAIEQLFTLVHDTGRGNTQVLISPSDPRIKPLTVPSRAPAWTKGLYEDITAIHQRITVND